MRLPLACAVETRLGERLPLARWTCLAVLLVAELAVLMLRFSTDSLRDAGQAGWADALWRWKFVLPPLAIAMSTAAILLGGDRLRDELRRVSAEIGRPHRTWPFLVGHLTAFALFAWLTAFILEGGFATSAVQGVWVALWFAAALGTLALWLVSACSPRLLAAVAWRRRAVLFTGVVVGTAAWSAGLVTATWWDPLRDATIQVVSAMVRVLAADAVSDAPNLIVGTERFRVRILSGCAGYEGIGLIWVFLSAYLWMCRDSLKFPHAFLLIPLGTIAVWLANVLRLTALIAIGGWISPAIALGGFHAYSGALLFCGVALALVFATRESAFFARRAEEVAAAPRENATAAYLMPFLAIVATTMVTGAFSAGGFDAAYPLRLVAAAAALLLYRRAYRGLRWTCSWEAAVCGVVAFVVWTALEPAPSAVTPGADLGASLAALPVGLAGLWLACRVVGSVVTVPIAEELAFRGYVARRLVAADFERVPFRTFTWFSFVGSSVLFGAMHGRWLAGTLAGMLYALVLYRRGELGDAVAAHATTNALIAAHVLTTGTWARWT